MTTQRSLLIIIPYWHGASTLPACLSSLEQSILPDGLSISVLLVHNGGTMTPLPEAFGEKLTVLHTRINIGFARAVNVGLEYAFRAGSDLIMLLNQDAVLAADCLTHLIHEAEKEPGIYSPRILDFDMRHTPDWYVLKYYPHIDFNTSDVKYALHTLSATCILATKSSFKTGGFFDPEFYMYYEDDDYFARYSKKGGKLFVVSAARAGHIGGSTEEIQGNSAFRKRTGVLKYLLRHHSGSTVLKKVIRHYGSCLKRLDFRRLFHYVSDDINTIAQRSYLIHATDAEINANARAQASLDGLIDS